MIVRRIQDEVLWRAKEFETVGENRQRVATSSAQSHIYIQPTFDTIPTPVPIVELEVVQPQESALGVETVLSWRKVRSASRGVYVNPASCWGKGQSRLDYKIGPIVRVLLL
jgi:hypothetical protein